MTTWLLSILGIGILDIIVLHFTEHSRIKKTIKTACSVLFVLVVIYPLPSLLSGKLEFDSYSFEFLVEIDSTMSDITHKNEVKLLEKAVQKALEADGYTAEIKIEAAFDKSGMIIKKITVVCDNYDRNIIIKISEYLNIGEEYIYIDARN